MAIVTTSETAVLTTTIESGSIATTVEETSITVETSGGEVLVTEMMGAPGVQGPQGEAGPQGIQGETGEQGPQGEVGPIGPQGEIGPQGPLGPQGPQGEIGPQGPQGNTGAQGPQGVQGVAGPKGNTGDTGPQGIQGPPGATGATGPTGPGVAAGGTTGQVAYKISNANYDLGYKTLAKSDVGLDQVDNTSDANKPISSAVSTALAGKYGTNGGQLSGTVLINGTTSERRLRISTNAGIAKYISIETAQSPRWQFGVDTSSEAGSNAGANFYLSRFDDAGTGLGNALTINRATGAITFSSAVSATSLSVGGNSVATVNDLTSKLDTSKMVYVRDEKPNGTAGGASVTGWQTRTLNTVKTNNISSASLSSNAVTLPAGTYYASARAPHFMNTSTWSASSYSNTQIYLQDVSKSGVTDGSDILLLGNSACAKYSVDAELSGVFTLAASTSIRLRQYCFAAYATNGLGDSTAATGSGGPTPVEVYSELTIWKVS